MKKLLILMLLGVLFVPMNGSAKADEVLYCQSELATGLWKDNGTWQTTSGIENIRLTIKVVGDFESIVGIFNDTAYSCRFPNITAPSKVAFSHNNGRTFFYDEWTKRFLLSHANIFTYLADQSPVFFAGTCEKF